MTNPQIFNNFVIFQTETGKVNVDVFFKNENLWLTQKLMAELFETSKQNTSLHIKNVFDSKELSAKSTVKEFLTVEKEGSREVSHELESDFDKEVKKMISINKKSSKKL